MSKNKSLFYLIAGAALISGPAAAQDTQDDAPQDVFIVEPATQPAPQPQPNGYPAQQPTAQPAQPPPQGYQPAPTAPQPGAPVYAQPYQPQPQYAPQPVQGRRLRAPYIEGAPMPPGGVLIERRRTGMIVSGAVIFGVPWISTLLVGVSIEEGAVAIPVIGPLLYLGNDLNRPANVGLVVDSLLQTTGLTLFILGMVMKRRYVEYYAENDGPQWSLLPQVGTTTGLQLDMRF